MDRHLKDKIVLNVQERIIKRKAMFIPLLCVSTFGLVGYVAADKEAPVIESSKIEVLYGDTLTKNMFEIHDNRDDLETLDVDIDTRSFDSKQLGTYIIPVSATDSFSNTTSKNVVVEVVDKTAPVLKSLNDNNGYTIDVEVKSSTDIKNYISAIDNVDGDVSSFITTDKKLDTSKISTQEILVSVDDNAGNSTQQKYLFNVCDTTAPTIKLKSGATVKLDYGKTFNYKDYFEIKDNYDKDVTIKLDGTIDSKKDGEQTVTLTATDQSNNQSSQKITVEVTDISAPKITLSSSKVTIKEGQSFNSKKYLTSAIDNKDGDLTSKVSIDGKVNTDKAGTYTVTYKVSDTEGNSSSKSLTVVVEESGAGIVKAAKSKLGTPYKWGATGPNAFDCSGFTQWVYRQNGKYIPRTSSEQKNSGTVVSLSQLKVGDLVWRPGHIGIYVGNGQVIHSPHTGAVVSYTSVSGFTCGVRY
jgi:cell wall-associated NlpC family hydrolase